MSGKGGKRDRRASFNFAVSTTDHGKLRILNKKNQNLQDFVKRNQIIWVVMFRKLFSKIRKSKSESDLNEDSITVATFTHSFDKV